MDIGQHIRERRKAAGFTLSQLAEASGVSSAMLSEIERDRKNPTIRTLAQIARGLGCHITDILTDSATDRVEIMRADRRPSVLDPGSGIRRESLTSSLNTQGLEVACWILPPRATTAEFPPTPPGVWKICYALVGPLEILIAGQNIRLDTGDSISFASDLPHGAANPHDHETQFIVIVHTEPYRANHAPHHIKEAPADDHA